MRVFVDCDDTLVRYRAPVSERGERDWDPMDDLIELLVVLHEHGWAEIVIWSTAGAEYARDWGCLLLPEIPFVASEKIFRWPRAEDICVDDMEIWSRGTNVTAEQFVKDWQVTLLRASAECVSRGCRDRASRFTPRQLVLTPGVIRSLCADCQTDGAILSRDCDCVTLATVPDRSAG